MFIIYGDVDIVLYRSADFYMDLLVLERQSRLNNK